MVAGLIVSAIALGMHASSTSAGVREVRLVVRDMTFYVEGQNDPNPVLSFRPGEQVRLVLRNEDAGMRHDFVVEAWQVATRVLEDRGEQDTIAFTVPGEPGTHTYHCTPHAKMMSGRITVQPTK